MAVPIDVSGIPKHSTCGFAYALGAPFKPPLSRTQRRASPRKGHLQANNATTQRPAVNGQRSEDDNAMNLEDEDDELVNQAWNDFESTQRQVVADSVLQKNADACPSSILDPEDDDLRMKLSEQERQLQELRDEFEKNVGEIHMLRDYLSQQEASEKENIRSIEEKHEKHVELVMQELSRTKKEEESLRTQLQFKERDLEELHAKQRHWEKQRKQCLDSSMSPSQPKRPKLSLERPQTKLPDASKFPDSISFEVRGKVEKNSPGPVWTSGKAAAVAVQTTGTSVGPSMCSKCSATPPCQSGDQHDKVGLAGRLASMAQKQFVLKQKGVGSTKQHFLQKLLSAAESSVYSMMNASYSSECRGDLLTLQKHPIVVSSGIACTPTQSPVARPGRSVGVHPTSSLHMFVLTKGMTPRKQLSFTSPNSESGDSTCSMTSLESAFNLQEILGEVVRQNSTSQPHWSPLTPQTQHSATDRERLQLTDSAELKLLPFLERCLRACRGGLFESTVSSNKSVSDSISVSSMSTTADIPDATLVCLLNCLLVLKTLVNYSSSVRATFLVLPPQLSDFSSVGSSFSGGATPSADFDCPSEEMHIEEEKEKSGNDGRSSAEPMDTAFNGDDADLATSTPSSEVSAREPTWNGQRLTGHPSLQASRFLTISQKNAFIGVTPPAPCATAGLTAKTRSAPPVIKGIKHILTPQLSLSEWSKLLTGSATSADDPTPCKSWPSSVSVGSCLGAPSRHVCSRVCSPIEDCARRLLGDIMLLASPKQCDGTTTVHLLVPIVCLEIFESLASNCLEVQVDRFMPLVTRGILVACVNTRQFVLMRLVSAVLFYFSKSDKMVQALSMHLDILRKLFHTWTDQPSGCTADEWRRLSLQLIQLAISLSNTTSHLLYNSALTAEVIKGLILLLHRELTEVTDMSRANLSTNLSACSERLLLLRHGACLLHLLWCRDSSFMEHRGAVYQYYVHLVCSLIRLFQQLSGICQVEVLSLQEIRDSDNLEEASQNSSCMETS